MHLISFSPHAHQQGSYFGSIRKVSFPAIFKLSWGYLGDFLGSPWGLGGLTGHPGYFDFDLLEWRIMNGEWIINKLILLATSY